METNKVMVIVDCGKEVCVNLLLNSVKTCVKETLIPFAKRAMDKELSEKEVGIAIKQLMKVGEIPKDEFVKELNSILEDLQTLHGKKEAQEYVDPTTKILRMAESLESKEGVN